VLVKLFHILKLKKNGTKASVDFLLNLLNQRVDMVRETSPHP